MGSSSTKTHDVPKSAYDNISKGTSQSEPKIYQDNSTRWRSSPTTTQHHNATTQPSYHTMKRHENATRQTSFHTTTQNHNVHTPLQENRTAQQKSITDLEKMYSPGHLCDFHKAKKRSSSTKTHDVPESAYDNISKGTSQSERKIYQDNCTTWVSSHTTTQHHNIHTPLQENRTAQQKSIADLEKMYSPGHLCDFHKVEKSNRSQINEHKSQNSKEIIPVPEKTPVATSQHIPPIKEKNVLKSIIKPPNKIEDLEDFIRNWNVWKQQLSSFLTITDEKKQKYQEWGSYFLNFMGPFGQEILNELFFNKEDDKKNYLILMQKYNAFYKFTTSVKSKDESVVKYIEKLKGEVAQNMKNVDKTLKKKIAREIEKLYKERFIALARSMLPKFNFETTFNSLTLTEIAFLWITCEESSFDSNRNCICCGNLHEEGKCPAFGKECNKCKRRNHFSKHCPGFAFINNCSFCGGNHEFRRCLAYGVTCSKCGKLNHFSWRCSKAVFLKNCRFCGLNHLMDRNVCPAKNSLCSICRQRGHYDIKCFEKQNLEQQKLYK